MAFKNKLSPLIENTHSFATIDKCTKHQAETTCSDASFNLKDPLDKSKPCRSCGFPSVQSWTWAAMWGPSSPPCVMHQVQVRCCVPCPPLTDLSMGCILVQLVLTGRPSILLRLQHYVQYPPPPSPSPHLQPVSDFTSLLASETPYSVSGHPQQTLTELLFPHLTSVDSLPAGYRYQPSMTLIC